MNHTETQIKSWTKCKIIFKKIIFLEITIEIIHNIFNTNPKEHIKDCMLHQLHHHETYVIWMCMKTIKTIWLIVDKANNDIRKMIKIKAPTLLLWQMRLQCFQRLAISHE